MLGIGSGGQYAPKAPGNIITPIGQGQIDNSYNNAQDALVKNNAFLDALNGQNGVGNQSSVFNQLQGVANGTGPNPAQAMLNQATGNNVAQQGALMASQRGAGANPALIARQAAQQGAGIQQNSAGQAATLQANQSLGALGQMGGIAQQMVGNRAGAINSGIQGSQGQEGQLLGAANNLNNVNAGIQGNINNNLTQQAQQQQAGIGGLLGGVGSVAGTLFGGPVGGAIGGLAGKVLGGAASPGASPKISPMGIDASALAPKSAADFGMAEGGPIGTIGKENYKGRSKAGAHLMMAHGGKVPALVSPGEKYLPPAEVKKVKEGKKEAIKAGQTIPGKPKVGGSKNSYANDTVPKTLDEGGIVLPRSVTMAKDPAKAAHAFVAAILARGKR